MTRKDLVDLLFEKDIIHKKEKAKEVLYARLNEITDANIITNDIFGRLFIQPIFSTSLIEILHLIHQSDTKQYEVAED